MRREKDDESGPERTCIATGAKAAPDDMLRFALSADGTVTPDIRRKLPGRGVWTQLGVEAVRRAASKGAFARAFRTAANAAPGLAEQVDALLAQDALQSLSMANKAGLVVTGAFKVDSAIANDNLSALIEASDGGADGASKRAKAVKARHGPDSETIARINLFPSAQLDLALGKANVIHAALKSGAASAAFVKRAERLRRYRTSEANRTANASSSGDPGIRAAKADRTDELAERPSD